MSFRSAMARGFTLIEMAIVLVVIGLILSGGILAVGPILQSTKTTETNARLDLIEKAILLHVIQNGWPAPMGHAAELPLPPEPPARVDRLDLPEGSHRAVAGGPRSEPRLARAARPRLHQLHRQPHRPRVGRQPQGRQARPRA